MDESYQDYINRVARLTLPNACSMQLQTIQHSPKFVAGKPVSFPGYSIITPPAKEDRTNKKFYAQVKTLQQQLSQQLEKNFLVLLPESSFHFTLADLVWDESYRQIAAANPNFDQELQQQIIASFTQYRDVVDDLQPLTWQLWGIVTRPRAIMACLVPKDQKSYDSIIQLRRSLYQNSGLIGLGIEQQYDLTAHITLGYFDQIPDTLNRDRLCIVMSQINDRLVESELATMTIDEIQLRKFEDMVQYNREPSWASIQFNEQRAIDN